MPENQVDEEFVRNLTGQQHRLYGLILSLLPDPNSARDVLQETNVVLWRKAGEFLPGSNFEAWASKIAYLQVLAFRSQRARDRHRFFDEELLGTLFHDSQEISPAGDVRTSALEQCLEQLPVHEQELLRRRYADGGSVKHLASESGKSSNAMRVALFRLRHALLECIERRLASINGEL